MISEIFPVTSHTKHVGIGTTFVAIKGYKEDGVIYIPEALQRGASVIVLEEHTILPESIKNLIENYNATIKYVSNSRRALAELSAAAYNYPARKLKIIGITGTKGKSTTTFLLEHIIKSAGYKIALLSTVKNRILDYDLPTQLTTQQPDYLHAFFNTCVDNNVEWVIMEVAAQALSLHRVFGLAFDAVIFTNFSQEHAEFYPDLDTYFAAKATIINQLKDSGIFVVNSDDNRVSLLHSTNKITVGFNNKPDVAISITKNNQNGLALTLTQEKSYSSFFCKKLVGTFNAYNLAMAITVAQKISIQDFIIQEALTTFNGVPGRLEKYNLPNGATAFIDYAHNPSSYEALFSTIRPFTDNLIIIFGCGGERDVTKRPIMGSIAATYSDFIILTSDNPRSEDPEEIIRQIKAGILEQDLSKVLVEVDREQAILKAYERSKSTSILLLLGKGPDEYQLIKGIKYPFSEAAILKSL